MFSLEHLRMLRAAEIEKIVTRLRPPGARLLELGAGTGQQAAELAARGFDVAAIEMSSSEYARDRVFPITEFDGRTIPFPDASFDIVFSSNVLEHVPDLKRMHAEIRRVLKPGGYALHVLPTHAWRFWSTLTKGVAAYQYVMAYHLRPRLPLDSAERARLRSNWMSALRFAVSPFWQRRHGERGNLITEHFYFRPAWWRKNFADHGFDIQHEEPMGLFYTGEMVLNRHLSLERRASLSRVLGSACHLFELRVRPDAL